MADMTGRYEKNWLKRLRTMSNVKAFAMYDTWPTGQMDKHNSLHKSMLLIWIKKPFPQTITSQRTF